MSTETRSFIGWLVSPDCVLSSSVRVHRMMGQVAAGGAGSVLNGTYVELCQSLPVDLLRPCLHRQMEVIFDILASYYVMTQWHKGCLQQQQSGG